MYDIIICAMLFCAPTVVTDAYEETEPGDKGTYVETVTTEQLDGNATIVLKNWLIERDVRTNR